MGLFGGSVEKYPGGQPDRQRGQRDLRVRPASGGLESTTVNVHQIHVPNQEVWVSHFRSQMATDRDGVAILHSGAPIQLAAFSIRRDDGRTHVRKLPLERLGDSLVLPIAEPTQIGFLMSAPPTAEMAQRGLYRLGVIRHGVGSNAVPLVTIKNQGVREEAATPLLGLDDKVRRIADVLGVEQMGFDMDYTAAFMRKMETGGLQAETASAQGIFVAPQDRRRTSSRERGVVVEPDKLELAVFDTTNTRSISGNSSGRRIALPNPTIGRGKLEIGYTKPGRVEISTSPTQINALSGYFPITVVNEWGQEVAVRQQGVRRVR